MTLIEYRTIHLRSEALDLIDKANTVLADMSAQGYTLTLRQLFYQFVSKNWIANTEKTYKRLGDVIAKGRLSGRISWTAIEDRGRGLNGWSFVEKSEDVVAGLEYNLSLDLWKRQPNYVEVWVEKDAMVNVLSKACVRLKVPFMACKGYLSLSEAWRAGRRFNEATERGQNPVLIYLGDHDPSGVHMTEDHRGKQDMFADLGHVDVRRIALNMDQVKRYDPPPNPTKMQDSRAKGYIKEFGHTCWELDALTPAVVDDLITEEVNGLRNLKTWKLGLQEQAKRRKVLAGIQDNWDVIERYLQKKI